MTLHPHISLLLQSLNRPFAERVRARQSLIDLGPSPHVVRVLADLATKAPESAVRAGAAHVLGKWGPHASLAVPALVAALDDPIWDVRMNAALALGRIGHEAAAPALRRVEQSDRASIVRTLAAEALQAIEAGRLVHA